MAKFREGQARAAKKMVNFMCRYDREDESGDNRNDNYSNFRRNLDIYGVGHIKFPTGDKIEALQDGEHGNTRARHTIRVTSVRRPMLSVATCPRRPTPSLSSPAPQTHSSRNTAG